jgi:peptidoglycan/xylan/chitin deacetylase (PgdA/CDA1 family)
VATERLGINETRIAKWKGDQTAAFLLMFDDGWPSHFQVAVPALAERGMTATFYINPGKGEYKKFADEWEQKVWRQGMAYGNHTYAHASVTNAAQAEQAIATCNEEILRIVPGNQPLIISQGTVRYDALPDGRTITLNGRPAGRPNNQEPHK